MHIPKTTLDPYKKLFSAHGKPKDHAKGFPTYLVPYTTGNALDTSDVNCSNQNLSYAIYTHIYAYTYILHRIPAECKPITLQNSTIDLLGDNIE